MLKLAVIAHHPTLGQRSLMQAMAALFPLLLVAAVLERRLLPLPPEPMATRMGRATAVAEAVFAWAVAILIFSGEYVALASLARPITTSADQQFVALVAAIIGGALLVPLLLHRTWTATAWIAGRDSHVLATLVVFAGGVVVAWQVIEAAV